MGHKALSKCAEDRSFAFVRAAASLSGKHVMDRISGPSFGPNRPLSRHYGGFTGARRDRQGPCAAQKHHFCSSRRSLITFANCLTHFRPRATHVALPLHAHHLNCQQKSGCFVQVASQHSFSRPEGVLEPMRGIQSRLQQTNVENSGNSLQALLQAFWAQK